MRKGNWLGERVGDKGSGVSQKVNSHMHLKTDRPEENIFRGK